MTHLDSSSLLMMAIMDPMDWQATGGKSTQSHFLPFDKKH